MNEKDLLVEVEESKLEEVVEPVASDISFIDTNIEALSGFSEEVTDDHS